MTRPAGRRETVPVKSLVHAIEVLEALAAAGELGLSAIARETGLSKTAVFNILATFESRRLVTRDPSSARYRLGWRLYELGAELLRLHDLAPRARPHLKRLSEAARETVLLGILDGQGVTYVDRCEADRAMRMVAAPGRQAPLHATASGKVLLAYRPEEERRSLLGDDLRSYTSHTVTDRAALEAELVKVRRNGWALCVREHESELTSISVPVRDFSGDVVAALTLAAPAVRFAAAARRRALPLLRASAEALGTDLGAPPDRA